MSAGTDFDRALILHQSGRPDEAWPIYLEVIRREPAHADAWHLSGLVAAHHGDFDDAIERIERATRLTPDSAIYWINLSLVAGNAGRLDRAEASARRAIDLEPGKPAAWLTLARLLRRAGRAQEAIASFDRCLVLDPQQPDVLAELAQEVGALGRHPAAIQLLERAVCLAPDREDLSRHLAWALFESGQIDPAISVLRRFLAAHPENADITASIGQAMIRQQRFDEAMIQYDAALQLDPGCALAEFGAIALHTRLGNVREALAVCNRRVARLPEDWKADSMRLFLLNYQPDLDADDLSALHADWGRRFSASHPALMQSRREDTAADGRPLRIGYVSGDFYTHSVAYFIECVLERHDRSRFLVHGYSSTREPDAVTQRIAARCDVWRDVREISDDELFKIIRADGIDILVDLSGHTADHRLAVFARRAAPVQVAWLGYPHATGLAEIDYRVVDSTTDPEDSPEACPGESLIRLPACFLCYRPPASSGLASFDAPSADGRPLTFGSFNQLAKINSRVIETWAALVRQVPNARLMLKAQGLGASSAKSRLRHQFNEAGVSPDRLILQSARPNLEDHLSTYQQIDIALDPFPYNGTTTTCEALWMGVPVIALAGDRHAARVGASLLQAVGHKELVATSIASYIDCAVKLARDPGRLSALHRTLQDDLRKSPLMDEPTFVRRLEDAYDWMWARGLPASRSVAKQTLGANIRKPAH